ncbi:MAG: hypothetical protein IK080_02475 [Clostridia bacterium]|nr:hypothetical protein [Clostridia bacterium]
MKRFAALLLLAALLLCTACGGKETIPETTAATDAETTSDVSFAKAKVQLTEEEQKLYDAFLTAQFRSYFEKEDTYRSYQVYKEWKYPPQIDLSIWKYAFYDLEQDGTNELLKIQRSRLPGEEYGVLEVYGISQGTVAERRLDVYNIDAYFCYPIVLSNGTLRSTIDYGHDPGYAYMELINGEYVVTKSITTPTDWFGSQDTYEYSHGFSTETLTYEEYKQKIKELDDGAVPVRLTPMTLLAFGQAHGVSSMWLDAPTNQTVSFEAPRSHPLPHNPHLAEEYDRLIESRLTVYGWAMEYYMKPDANYGHAEPAKPYFALYDLNGNGDEELILGEKRGEEIAITAVYYFADAASEAAAELRIEDEGINGSFTVLSNGWIVCETKLNGSVSNSDRHYWGIGETVQRAELWQYGKEAALYDLSGTPSQEGQGYIMPISLNPKAYERQRAVFEEGAETVALDWKPLEEYGK